MSRPDREASVALIVVRGVALEEMTLEQYHKKYGQGAEIRLARNARKVRFKQTSKLRSKQDWEQAMYDQICDLGLPKPLKEHQFHPTRRFRFDFAWPARMIAVEVEGGIWGNVVSCHRCGTQVMQKTNSGAMVKVRAGGRHQKGAGFTLDCEKYSSAAIQGWCVIRVTPEHIRDGKAIQWIEEALDRNLARYEEGEDE